MSSLHKNVLTLKLMLSNIEVRSTNTQNSTHGSQQPYKPVIIIIIIIITYYKTICIARSKRTDVPEQSRDSKVEV